MWDPGPSGVTPIPVPPNPAAPPPCTATLPFLGGVEQKGGYFLLGVLLWPNPALKCLFAPLRPSPVAPSVGAPSPQSVLTRVHDLHRSGWGGGAHCPPPHHPSTLTEGGGGGSPKSPPRCCRSEDGDGTPSHPHGWHRGPPTPIFLPPPLPHTLGGGVLPVRERSALFITRASCACVRACGWTAASSNKPFPPPLPKIINPEPVLEWGRWGRLK